MALSADEKERIMASRGESQRGPSGKTRRFSIKFRNGKSTTMLDPAGRNIGDIWESAAGRFGIENIIDIQTQGE